MSDPSHKRDTSAALIPLASQNRAEHAAALHQAILKHRGTPVEINGDTVEFLSALAGQVLFSAAHTWRLDGVSFTISGVCDRLRDDFRLLGLSDLLLAESGAEA